VLWALGECARNDVNSSRRRWAADLFAEAVPTAATFQSPRAWAFTLLGLAAFRSSFAQDARAAELQKLLAAKLFSILTSVETKDWVWFEEGLAYDNPRLPQALIVTGAGIGDPAYVDAGLRSLRWIMTLQTSDSGLFRPVGSQGFDDKRARPRPFDQQPLEATAAVSACLAAWRVDGDPSWKGHAVRAFEWFLGGNDLAIALVDPETGSCCDGLHPGRANQNRGGESVVSYLLGLAEMRGLSRITGIHAKTTPLRVVRTRIH
jgi:hypothetical protein